MYHLQDIPEVYVYLSFSWHAIVNLKKGFLYFFLKFCTRSVGVIKIPSIPRNHPSIEECWISNYDRRDSHRMAWTIPVAWKSLMRITTPLFTLLQMLQSCDAWNSLCKISSTVFFTGCFLERKHWIYILACALHICTIPWLLPAWSLVPLR